MSVILPDTDNFVKATLTHAQQFEKTSLSALSANTKFILENRGLDGNFTTNTCDYSQISTYNVNYVRTAPEVTLSGKWVLSGKNSNTMTFGYNQLLFEDRNYDADRSSSAGNAAITYEFYVRGLLQKIYDLSAEIFQQPHVPSYVGMIVQSGTLSTEAALKKIYGSNTSWEQINFAFMCGYSTAGNVSANNYSKYGELAAGQFDTATYKLNVIGGPAKHPAGQDYVNFTESNIINHTHRFKAESETFMLKWEGGIEGEIYTMKSTGKGRCDASNSYRKPRKDLRINKLKVSVKGEHTISTASLYGELRSTTNAIWTYSGDGAAQVATNTRHSNMPPFITKYVWKRKG